MGGAAVVLVAALAAKAASAPLAEGDLHYARRAEGARGAVAQAGPVDEAIDAYRRALLADPDSLLVRAHLIRALFFRSTFVPTAPEPRKALLEEARQVGEEGVERIERPLGKASGAARLEALRRVPNAVDIYFWTAVAWGQWALTRGKLAAARKGAGSRIRDLSQRAVDLDPAFEQGGGHLILGRLHDQSPRIPFLMGWISRPKGVASLRAALAYGPHNTVNQFFLAEALLNHEPGRKEEARLLLTECAAAVPRPEYLVEDAHYKELARQRLAVLR
jgi:tetratricopeptide (TPR) repeat protein